MSGFARFSLGPSNLLDEVSDEALLARFGKVWQGFAIGQTEAEPAAGCRYVKPAVGEHEVLALAVRHIVNGGEDQGFTDSARSKAGWDWS